MRDTLADFHVFAMRPQLASAKRGEAAVLREMQESLLGRTVSKGEEA